MSNEAGSRRVALVTGGTRGIGLGIARSLAAEGFDLALCGRRPEDAVREQLDELRALGADVAYRPCDLAERSAREALLDAELADPPGVGDLAAAFDTATAATEAYLLSATMVDPENPAARSYLDALGAALGLAPELTAELERQATDG